MMHDVVGIGIEFEELLTVGITGSGEQGIDAADEAFDRFLFPVSFLRGSTKNNQFHFFIQFISLLSVT